MSAPAAFICGVSGLVPTPDEKRFIADADPLGFILFARNCGDPEQVRGLICDLRSLVGRLDAPILTDQEGGRVARLTEPHWRRPPAPGRIAALFQTDPETAIRAAEAHHALIAAQCRNLGVDVVCTPVLDLPQPAAHPVIGDRAWGNDVDRVATLAKAAMRGLAAGGATPVIKHLPGHGRATVDSHKSLPEIDAPLETLRSHDFRPFAELNAAPWGMTGHVVLAEVDPDRPVTLSERVIRQIVRGEIGFDGLLLTDDLSMQALNAPMRDRAAGALAAGCDVALHCNGDLQEMRDVAAGSGRMTDAAVRRFQTALAERAPVDREITDEKAAAERLDSLLSDSESDAGTA